MVIKKKPYGAIQILEEISRAYYKVKCLDDCLLYRKNHIMQIFLCDSEIKPITYEQLSLLD